MLSAINPKRKRTTTGTSTIAAMFLVRLASYPNVCQSKIAFNTAMTAARTQADTFIQPGFANWPIFNLSPVNMTSGTTAKLSIRLRITWLRISNWAVPLSPIIAVTMTAGTMATSRVTRRRTTGCSRHRRKPFMIICPASVPVRLEF
jgi:hypothetical protein